MTLLILAPQYEKMIYSFIGISILFFLFHLINLVVKNKKLEKLLSIRNYFLLIFISLIPSIINYFNKRENLWNDKSVAVFKAGLIKELDSVGMPFSEKQKNEFAECVVEKNKTKFRMGLKTQLRHSTKQNYQAMSAQKISLRTKN